MDWTQHHQNSERKASDADVARFQRDYARARQLYQLAAEAEELALPHIPSEEPETLGTLTVSAVALWYKAGAYAQARTLATHWLKEPNLPSFAQIQLQDLLAEIEKLESLTHEIDVLRIAAPFSPSAREHLTKTVAEWKRAA